MTTASHRDPSLPLTPGRRPGRAVAVGVGLTLLAFVASLVGGLALAIPAFLLDLDFTSTPVLVALTAAGQLGLLAVGYGYARYTDLRVRIAVPSRGDLAHVVGGLVLALVLVGVLSVVLTVLNLVPGSVIEDVAAADPTVLLALAVLSVVLVAPAEEFLFRGVVQGRLRHTFGPVAAIAGASLLFGSLHLANYTGALAPIIAAALLIAGVGSVFGVLYERTDNLAVPIAAHAVYNVLLFVTAFLTL